MNKCTSCGAPVEDSDEKCQYCGTITPYGEKIAKIREQKKQELERRKREEERAREMNAMPAMKYIPGVLIALFYAVTLGLYSPYWYITRMKNLNSLKSKAKIPAWVVNLFAVLCVYMLVALPHYRADSFLDSQIEKLKEKHRREGRILYIPQNEQEENIDFGTRLSAFGIGMASALNGGIFDGFGRIAGIIGKGIEYISPFSGSQADERRKITALGIPLAETKKIIPDKDSWLTSVAKDITDVYYSNLEGLNDKFSQLTGGKNFSSAQSARDAGTSVLGFKAVMCDLLILSVWLAMRTRNMLREHSASCGINANIEQPNVMIVLFDTAYLQFEINDMIHAGLLRQYS